MNTKEKIAYSKSLTRMRALHKEKCRRESKRDFYSFCHWVMRFDVLYEPLHRPLCDFISNEETRQKLVILPRGTLKTSIGSIAFPLWKLVSNPNLRVLIDSEKNELAIQIVRAMRQYFDSDWFRTFYPERCHDRTWRKTRLWRQDQLTVRGRTKGADKEPSVSAGGIGVAQTGRHYDLIIMDDLHSELNTNTRAQIQKVDDHIRLMLPVLEPGGIIIMVGTRWDHGDAYAMRLDEPGWDKMIRPCYNEDGSLLYPTRLTEDFLQEQRRNMDSYRFASQYLVDPVSPDEACFRPPWPHWSELPPGLEYYCTVDPALSQASDGDWTAITVGGVTIDNDLYIREIQRGRLTPSQIIGSIFDIHAKYRQMGSSIHTFGIEGTAYQQALIYWMQEEMRRRDQWLSVTELKRDTAHSKERRIRAALEPRFRANAIFLPPQRTDGVIALEEELLRFPRARFDDCLDSLADLAQITHAGRGKVAFPDEIRHDGPGNMSAHIAAALRGGNRIEEAPQAC